MVKLVITLLNILVLLVLQLFPGNVSVKLNAPSDVQAGSEFEVKVTVNKGDLEGFSRFQQNIPAGLTASPGTSSNADFSFSDKRVRLIWLRVPESDEVTVSYKVKVDERLKGTFTLAGKFSYIADNERKSVDIEPVSINIQPSPDIDPSLIVDINDFEKISTPGSGTPENISVACIRQKPLLGTQGDYVVNVLVNKNLSRQFAKIEEEVPAGFTAVAINPKDAIFTFKDQKVKFLWMNVPADPYFTVSYRLIPKNQVKLAAPQIKGAFSYLVDEQSVSVGIVERDLDIAAITPETAQEMIAMALAQPDPVYDNQTAQLPADTKADTEKATRDEKVIASIDSNKPVKTKNQVRNRTARETTRNSTASSLNPEKGVYYRIQLAAGHKPVNINRYFSKMNLEKKVSQETHDD